MRSFGNGLLLLIVTLGVSIPGAAYAGNDDLIAHYRFDESEEDSTGTQLDAVLEGATWYDAGHTGDALHMAGDGAAKGR